MKPVGGRPIAKRTARGIDRERAELYRFRMSLALHFPPTPRNRAVIALLDQVLRALGDLDTA